MAAGKRRDGRDGDRGAGRTTPTRPSRPVVEHRRRGADARAAGGRAGVAIGNWHFAIPRNIPDERAQAAMAFFQWFLTKEAQDAYAEAGGIPVRTDVLEALSDEPEYAWMKAYRTNLDAGVQALGFAEGAGVDQVMALRLNQARHRRARRPPPRSTRPRRRSRRSSPSAAARPAACPPLAEYGRAGERSRLSARRRSSGAGASALARPLVPLGDARARGGRARRADGLADPEPAVDVAEHHRVQPRGGVPSPSRRWRTSGGWPATGSSASSLWMTLLFVIASVTIEMVLGFLLALVVSGVARGKGVIRTLMILPILVPPVAIGSMWKLMYGYDFGILNQALGLVGLGPVGWLSNTSLALWSVVIVDVWHWTPLVFLILFAGVEGLPARGDRGGAGRRRDALADRARIILPLMAPAIAVAFVFRVDPRLQGLRPDLPADLRRPGHGDRGGEPAGSTTSSSSRTTSATGRCSSVVVILARRRLPASTRRRAWRGGSASDPAKGRELARRLRLPRGGGGRDRAAVPLHPRDLVQVRDRHHAGAVRLRADARTTTATSCSAGGRTSSATSRTA